MEITTTNHAIINQIKSIIEQARQNVSLSVNRELLHSYWQIGKLIVDSEKSTVTPWQAMCYSQGDK